MQIPKEPNSRTTHPIVTGTSVLGIEYDGGVMIMADTLGSYGSLARFHELERLRKITNNTLIGCGGEYSDFQYIMRLLDEVILEDFMADDGQIRSSKEIHNFLTRVMYAKRSNIQPLYNQLLIAGYEDSTPFLGYIDLYGSSFKDHVAATGFGMHLAIPILRKEYRPDMTEEQARSTLEDCMKVLFYRDGRTINRFQIAKATKTGVEISAPYSLDTNWEFQRFVDPSHTAL